MSKPFFGTLEIGQQFYVQCGVDQEWTLATKTEYKEGFNATSERGSLLGFGVYSRVYLEKPADNALVAATVSAPAAAPTNLPTPQQKRRILVLAINAPAVGHAEDFDGVTYKCTGTGSSWVCRDNASGNTSWEGELVCYAYYQLSN